MTEPINSEIAQKTARMIAWLWERSLPQVEERLRLLERAAAANTLGEMAEEQRSAAQEIAHKLAGSLGMFGFLLGSKIASQLEMQFESGSPDPALLVELTGQLRGSLDRQTGIRDQGPEIRE
jgi:HPt (histidine-containing phosphotransfer) domain-containing protein